MSKLASSNSMIKNKMEIDNFYWTKRSEFEEQIHNKRIAIERQLFRKTENEILIAKLRILNNSTDDNNENDAILKLMNDNRRLDLKVKIFRHEINFIETKRVTLDEIYTTLERSISEIPSSKVLEEYDKIFTSIFTRKKRLNDEELNDGNDEEDTEEIVGNVDESGEYDAERLDE